MVEVVEVVGSSRTVGADAPTTANQSLYRSKSAANWSPVKPTEPSLPITCSSSTRPPSCPRPLRCVTSTCRTAPTEGNAASILLSGILHVQVCTGLALTESPRSRTAGNAPPAE